MSVLVTLMDMHKTVITLLVVFSVLAIMDMLTMDGKNCTGKCNAYLKHIHDA